MASEADMRQRSQLPVPDRVPPGVTTYDAKDPDTHYPPIEPVRPPAGAPNVLVILIDDVGFGACERLRRAVPHAERRTPGRRRIAVQPLPHHRAVLADPRSAADRPQPPHGRHGRHHRDRHLPRPATTRSDPTRWRRLPEMLRLNGYSTAQFGKCHEVPVWETSPVGPVRPLADRRRRLRVLLRLHRRRDQPVLPGALRRHHAGRAAEDPGGGLPPDRGPGRQGHRLGPPAEGR